MPAGAGWRLPGAVLAVHFRHPSNVRGAGVWQHRRAAENRVVVRLTGRLHAGPPPPSLEKANDHRVLGQGVVLAQAHLLEDAGAIGAHRGHREAECLGAGGHRLARGEQPEDLELPVGQQFVRGAPRSQSDLAGKPLGQDETDIPPARQHAPDRGDEVGGAGLLGQVTGGPGAQHPDAELLLRIHAQHQHRHPGLDVPQLLQHLEPALARQRDVEDDGVPFRRFHHAQGLLAARRLAEDGVGDGVLEDLLETLPHHGVIVHEQDAGHRGRITSTVVPWVAFGWIARSPPSACARSRMPSSPMDRESLILSSGMPPPLSLISRITRQASAASRMSIAVAPAWRATLVSASCRMRKRAVAWSGLRAVPAMVEARRQEMPVRFSKSATYHSTAALRPSSSRMPGRSSLMMRCTASDARSSSCDMSWSLPASASRAAGAGASSCRSSQPTSRRRAVSICPTWSWPSRARRAPSSSRAACSRAESARNPSWDCRRRSMVRFFSVMSRPKPMVASLEGATRVHTVPLILPLRVRILKAVQSYDLRRMKSLTRRCSAASGKSSAPRSMRCASSTVQPRTRSHSRLATSRLPAESNRAIITGMLSKMACSSSGLCRTVCCSCWRRDSSALIAASRSGARFTATK